MEPQLQIRLMMLAIWLFMAYKTAKPYLLSVKSVSWDKVIGTVTTSSFDRDGVIYIPKIIYQYSINGHEYLNDTYTYLGTASLSKANAIKTAQAYPVNSELQLYVDSNNYQNSVIIPGVHWLQYMSFAGLTVFCLTVAYLVQILNFIWPGCQPNCT